MYHGIFLDSVSAFLSTLSVDEQAKIKLQADAMRSGYFQKVYIKTLRNRIKELIVQDYRILFFIKRNVIYFVSAFRKKTAKTPRAEIERAERIYKMMQSL